MSFTIKRATPDDISALVGWRGEVSGEIYKDKMDSISPAYLEIMKYETKKYYEENIPTDGHIAGLVFVGEEKAPAGCLGMCFGDVLPTPDNPNGKCAYITNIYIREEFHGQDLETIGIKWLIMLAREHGAGRIYLETAGLSKEFCKSLGFDETGEYMLLGNTQSGC